MAAKQFYLVMNELHHEIRDPSSLTDEEKQLRSDLGENLFHYMILESDMEIVKRLADIGIPIDEPNDFMQTPLFECAMIGFVERAEYLLKRGADPNRKNKYGESMLDCARRSNHVEVVELLLEYGATDEPVLGKAAIDGCAESPLHAVAWAGQLEEARALLESGADVNYVDSAGEAAISGAAGWGHSEMVKLLLEFGARVDIVAKETSDYTPLHWAARSGCLKTVQLLVAAGADTFACDDRGRTPREIAEERGHREVAEFIRAAEEEDW